MAWWEIDFTFHSVSVQITAISTLQAIKQKQQEARQHRDQRYFSGKTAEW